MKHDLPRWVSHYRYGRVMQAISGCAFNYSFPRHFWPVLARSVPASRFRAGLPVRRVLLRCCATTAVMAGSCCTCSATRRRCAGRFLVGRKVDGLAASCRPARCTRRMRRRCAMSDLGYRNKNQAGVQRLGQQSRSVRSRSEPRHHDAASRLRAASASRSNGEYRQLNANRAADRERVLQLHPAEARRTYRRAPHPGAAARAGVQYVEMRVARRQRLRSRSASTRTSCGSLEAFAAFLRRARAPAIEPGRAGGARRQPRAGCAAQDAQPGLLLRRDGARRPAARLGARDRRLDARCLRAPGRG